MREGSDRGSSSAEFGVLLAALALVVLGAASVAGEGLKGILASAAAVLGG